MKEFLVLLFSVIIVISCNQPAATETVATKDTSVATAVSAPVTYAYPINLYSDFEIGDAKYAQKVTELWKDFDDNNFTRNKDAFGDTIEMHFRDGSSMRASQDSMIAAATQMRSAIAEVASSVDVIVSLKPTGKDETWVCIWGKSVETNAKGKKDSVYLHEAWEFDKNGKVILMYQYGAAAPKK